MPLRILILALIAATALTGCGRRGSLEAPGEPETVAAPAPLEPPGSTPAAATASPGATEPPETAPVGAPERHFFLDPLI